MATSDNSTAPATSSSGPFTFGSGISAASFASLAQPTIDAIHQQITAALPSSYASAITAQFAGGSPAAQPSMSGTAPTFTFSYPQGSAAASVAQPTITAIQQQIAALLPSDLASAITSQFAGASVASGQGGVTVQPPTGSAAPTLALSDEFKAFFSSIPQTM